MRWTGRGRDIVSIVIPVYNGEQYLSECLGSVIAQTYPALEVIIVDDGSRDGSAEVAASYAAQDSRLRVIRQPHTGAGAARNTGARHVHGRYLCFADSDDTMPADAIKTMVRSLRATGSDFALGSAVPSNARRTWRPGWPPQVPSDGRERVTVDQFPEALRHTFVWAKLFDTTFFRRAVGSFPERLRYDDQEPVATAFVAATFDALATTVYRYRVHEDATTMAEQKSDPADLREHMAMAGRVADIVSGGAGEDAFRTWLANTLGIDLRPYFEQLPRTDEDFFDQLRREITGLAERATAEVWQLVPIHDRLAALAVLAGLRDDTLTVVCRRLEYGWFVPTDTRSGCVRLAETYLADTRLELSPEQLRLTAVDLAIVAKASSLWWHGSTLRLAGHAYLTNLASGPDTTTTRIELVGVDGQRVAVPIRDRRDERIDFESRDAWNSQEQSGFVVEFTPDELLKQEAGPWHVEVTVTGPDVACTAVLDDYDRRGIGGTTPMAAVPEHGHGRWKAGFDRAGRLLLRHITPVGSPITALRSDGQCVSMTVDDPDVESLLLTCRSSQQEITITGRREPRARQVRFDITVPELSSADDPAGSHTWTVRAQPANDQPRRVTYQGDADALTNDSPEHHALRAVTDQAGTLRLAQQRWRAVADTIHTERDRLIVTGRICAAGATAAHGRMVSNDELRVIEPDQTTIDTAGETFSLRFPITIAATAATGRDGFTVRMSVYLDGRHQEQRVTVAQHLQQQLPCDVTTPWHTLLLSRTKTIAGLRVRVRPGYFPDERGRLAQQQLHHHFHTPARDGGGLSPQLRDAVLFQSFHGRQVADSVLALCHELRERNLGLALFWSVADLSMPVPEGTIALLMGSRAWLDVLHHARYLVNNTSFPSYFRKRAGQTYVQTWHGSPLKRVANDKPLGHILPALHQRMQREAGYWDYLLAQSDFAAATLPGAFGYEGPVLNLGYPRNDALVDSRASRRRNRARTELGVSDQHQVILYAPTWRDNASVATGYALVSHLDFAAAQAATSEDTVFLLRGHNYTTHYVTSQPEGVIDVSHYPDINDLLLAADVLITDYSSLIFDYAVTGKPMLFLTPDLDEYRNQTRGFYLDFEAIAPGPICQTNDELISALANAVWTDPAYTARYQEFVDRFAPRDDGAAAARVVDAVWGASSGSALATFP